jgi:putative toxin-antitoxin system antitoxin component (TIGR02293 family)
MIPTVSALHLVAEGRERNADPAEAVRRGFASASIDRLAKLLGITKEELAGIIGLSRATMHRRRSSGSRLRPDESDRVFRVASALAAAQDVFENAGSGAIWLRSPNPVFAGKRPLDLLDTEIGFAKVLRLLGHIEHGIGP